MQCRDTGQSQGCLYGGRDCQEVAARDAWDDRISAGKTVVRLLFCVFESYLEGLNELDV